MCEMCLELCKVETNAEWYLFVPLSMCFRRQERIKVHAVVKCTETTCLENVAKLKQGRRGAAPTTMLEVRFETGVIGGVFVRKSKLMMNWSVDTCLYL